MIPSITKKKKKNQLEMLKKPLTRKFLFLNLRTIKQSHCLSKKLDYPYKPNIFFGDPITTQPRQILYNLGIK